MQHTPNLHTDKINTILPADKINKERRKRSLSKNLNKKNKIMLMKKHKHSKKRL